MINALIEEKCLTKIRLKDFEFYKQNISNLILPPCPSVKNYYLYADERKEICQNLIEKMSELAIDKISIMY